MAFKDHFSGHATSYAQARPTYPDDLFRFLADQCPDLDCAWDCATGNGQAARVLTNYFERVIATDASLRQIEAARPQDGIEYRVAPAESSGLPAESVGLVTVAQALHWFDIEKFFVEAERVLVPTGVLAFWCYGLCSVADGLDDLLAETYSLVDEYWPPERDFVDTRYRDIVAPFPSIDCPSFSMEAEWTVEQMLAYQRTWSASQAFMRTTGKDPIIDFEGPLRQLWGQQTRRVSWPLTLLVCRRQPS